MGAFQIFPSGEFRASQGALLGSGPWRCSADSAARVIAAARGRGLKIAIDYGHQTLLAEKNGQPAPAAGWIDPARLVWDEGRGLFDPAPEWTAKAAAAIDAGEFRYGSPVFRYDPASGEVLELLHVALLNTPAIDGFKPVGAASASPTSEDALRMKSLLKPLGLPEDADELAALAALSTLITERDGLRSQLDQAQTAAASAAPLALVTQLQGEIAALKAGETAREVDGLIAAGLADGRILPTMEAWARGLAATSVQSLRDYLAQAQPIAALTASQTGGKQPAGVGGGSPTLNADELAVCKAMGYSPDDFIKARMAEQEG
jgi:phage I-like protein